MKVCIADDHASIRRALVQMLTLDLDVEEVVEAATGAEALDLVAGGDVSLVLMDVHMPGGDGVTATRQIREHDGRVRVVALTAAQDSRSVAAMIAAGADSYLVKTTPPNELRESLRAILDGQVVLAPTVLPVVVGDLARRLRAEQERADALDALDRTKREFVSLVSDQLRNPVTAITGYTRTLQIGWDRVDETTKREFLDRIDEQAGRLERRVEQILAVARLQTSKDHTGEDFGLDAVVREVLDRCHDLLVDRKVTAHLEPGTVAGDRQAVSEVVRSLVDNVITHTTGGCEVRLRHLGDEVVLEIKDEGPGIEQHLLDVRLSEPFLPGDASDTRPASGLGLSLYIARRVVESASGRLALESGPDRGTLARMHLPAASTSSPRAGWSRGESNP